MTVTIQGKEVEIPQHLVDNMKHAASSAIQVQDACNLSGVVMSWSNILSESLWPMARALNKGTAWVNKHPINVLFTDKVAAMAECDCINYSYYSEALRLCRKIQVTGEDYETMVRSL